MSTELYYYILDGNLVGSLEVDPTWSFSKVRRQIYNDQWCFFDVKRIPRGGLDLFAPSDLQRNPLEGLAGLVYDKIQGLPLLDLAEEVQDHLKNLSDGGFVHLVIKVRPTGICVPTPRNETSAASIPAIRVTYAAEGWQEEKGTMWNTFYDHWRKQDYDQKFQETIISLGLPVLSSSKGKLLVLDSYRTLVDRVIKYEHSFPGRGVLVTGQPGTGKTTWLWYILVCLIMKREPVAFYSDKKTRLYHGGRVYFALGTASLPPSFIRDTRVWSLINSDAEDSPPPPFLVSKDYPIFPVQAASPDEARYKIWVKARRAAVFGMPLWSVEQLKQGFELYEEYIPYRDALQEAIKARKLPHDQILKDAYELVEKGGSRSTSLERAERAMQRLVKRAAEQYGRIPRDLYFGIFDHISFDKKISKVMHCISLEDLVRLLSDLTSAPPRLSTQTVSHKLLAVDAKPDSEGVWSDVFTPNFRSEAIAKMVVQQVGYLNFEQARQLCRLYRHIPQSSVLAGWMFKTIAHAALMKSNPGSNDWNLYPMHQSKKAKTMRFMALEKCKPPHLLPLRVHAVTVVEFAKWVPNEDYLFVPKKPNNPLFDSFFVQLKKEANSVTPIIWFFQATLAESHEGSKPGWPEIRSIKTRVEEYAHDLVACMESGAMKRKRSVNTKINKVELKYVLVCPSPSGPRNWTMPGGWGKSVEGDVFCLFISLPKEYILSNVQ